MWLTIPSLSWKNIFRHIQNDDDRRQAVLVGTRDVAIAILASTVTTVIVFLPIGLVGGLIGEFFLPFGLTVAYALGSSFIVAVTIVPLLAFLLFRKENLPQERETVMQRWYTPVLQFSLNHRAIALAIAGLLFVGSMYILSQRPQSILPDFGEVQLSATVDLPSDTTMAETVDLVTKFEASLTGVEGLGTKQTEVGAAGGMQAMFAGGGGVNQSVANISIAVEDSGRLDELTGIVREKAEQVFGAEYVTVSGGSMSSGAFSGFSLVLSGDPEQLAAIDADVIATLEGVDGLANVSSNLANTEVIIRVSGRPSLRYDGAVESQNTMGVTAAAKAAVAAIVPDGVTVSEGSQSEMQSQSFAQAIQAIVIAIVAVYLALIMHLPLLRTSLHHSVQPTDGHRRRSSGTVAYRPCGWLTGAGGADDAGRHRGDQRHCADRQGSGQPQETRDGCDRCLSGRRAHPPASHPDDGHRHHPGPNADGYQHDQWRPHRG